MRIVLSIVSVIGLLVTGLLALFVMMASSAWGGKVSLPVVILVSLAGFTATTIGSTKGYFQNWYKPVALFGAILVAVSAYPWLQSRDPVYGFLMIGFAILVTIDAFKNH